MDAFIGLDQVRELGAIVRRVLTQAPGQPNRRLQLLVDSTDRPTFPITTRRVFDSPRRTQRLSENRRRLQSSVQFLRHPANARATSQPAPGSVLAEIRALVAEGVKEINLISQDTTYYGMDLWAEKAGPRQPVDSSRGPTLAALLARNPRQSTAISGFACFTRILRIGAMS